MEHFARGSSGDEAVWKYYLAVSLLTDGESGRAATLLEESDLPCANALLGRLLAAGGAGAVAGRV